MKEASDRPTLKSFVGWYLWGESGRVRLQRQRQRWEKIPWQKDRFGSRGSHSTPHSHSPLPQPDCLKVPANPRDAVMESKRTPEQGQKQMAGKKTPNDFGLFLKGTERAASKATHTRVQPQNSENQCGWDNPMQQNPLLAPVGNHSLSSSGETPCRCCIRPRCRGALVARQQWDTQQSSQQSGCLGCFCWLLPPPFSAAFY